jgi:hypothetical protein
MLDREARRRSNIAPGGGEPIRGRLAQAPWRMKSTRRSWHAGIVDLNQRHVRRPRRILSRPMSRLCFKPR